MLPRSREIQSQRPNGFVTKRFPKNGYIGRGSGDTTAAATVLCGTSLLCG